MSIPQILIIVGIALLVIAVVGFAVNLLISHSSKAKLEKQLDAEYGKKRN